jgi:hypothetical protein
MIKGRINRTQKVGHQGLDIRKAFSLKLPAVSPIADASRQPAGIVPFMVAQVSDYASSPTARDQLEALRGYVEYMVAVGAVIAAVSFRVDLISVSSMVEVTDALMTAVSGSQAPERMFAPFMEV